MVVLWGMLGFAGGAVGPVIFGAALDSAGGATAEVAWATAYILLAALTLLGPLMMVVVRPRDLPGDGRRRAHLRDEVDG